MEGKNIDDRGMLIELGPDIGLDEPALDASLAVGSHADHVAHDMREAHELGIDSVPFFAFDRKYAIAGAQRPPVFTHTLGVAHDERSRDDVAMGSR